MTGKVTRRGFGGLALGAVSAGAVGAQTSPDGCQATRTVLDWEARVGFLLGNRYSYELRHTPTGFGIGFQNFFPAGSFREAETIAVRGLADIFRRVSWFTDFIHDNGPQDVRVMMLNPRTGAQWDAGGRAEGIVDSSGRDIAVYTRIGNDKALELYDLVTTGDRPDIVVEAVLILPDGTDHLASYTRLSTYGVAPLRDGVPAMLDELAENLDPEMCRSACFLTTACCAAFGRPDDGLELRTLRDFRDGWLADQPGGAGQIAEYYRIAPPICAAIAADPMGRWELGRIYFGMILPCVALIKLGWNAAAQRRYTATTERLQRRYGAGGRGTDQRLSDGETT